MEKGYPQVCAIIDFHNSLQRTSADGDPVEQLEFPSKIKVINFSETWKV
jgi:hypothetical protein